MKKAVLAVLASFLALSPSAALAEPPEPGPQAEIGNLVVAPAELKAGAAVTVVGTGCAPGNQVRFEVYNPDLSSSADGTAKSDGTFSQAIRFAPSSNVGRTWLRATCLTSDSRQRVMQAVLLVSRPDFLVTGVNLAFGAGSTMVVFGLGLLVLRGSRSPAGRRKLRR